MIYGPNDSWQALHDEWFAIERLLAGQKDEAECPIMLRVRAGAVRTVGEGLTGISERREVDHLNWIARHGLHLLDRECRGIVLRTLGEYVPPRACMIYLRRADLSDEEDAILWDAFAPKMPVMREKIAQRRAPRAKDHA